MVFIHANIIFWFYLIYLIVLGGDANSPASGLEPMLGISLGGKKQKIRPGDILGALTGENGIQGKQVGKIHIFDNWSYVAVDKDAVKAALRKLGNGKLKGRTFRARQVRD